jgi:hypothetical protein
VTYLRLQKRGGPQLAFARMATYALYHRKSRMRRQSAMQGGERPVSWSMCVAPLGRITILFFPNRSMLMHINQWATSSDSEGVVGFTAADSVTSPALALRSA